MTGHDDIELSADDYRLAIRPSLGGAITRFEWRGWPVFRPMAGSTILDVGCFPMVPFVNRIAHGRFTFGGESIRLSPNFPGEPHPHPLHGDGWLSDWRVERLDAGSLRLILDRPRGDWPWAYTAWQSFDLSPTGLTIELALRSDSDRPMPAAIGLHPYFPLIPGTRYRGRHRGAFATRPDGLPQRLTLLDAPAEWFADRPIARCSVDTVHANRDGPLSIAWPERGIELVMHPDPIFAFTGVFVQPDHGLLCIEPMSEQTDAVNQQPKTLRILAPGDTIAGSVRMEVGLLAS